MPLQREYILAVEDAPDFQLMIKASLEKHYSLTVVATLEHARARLARQNYDLLLLDVNLPDGDGFVFCGGLRAEEATRSVPVIFLTARADLEDRLKGFSFGADDYIVKPFEGLELRARVEAKLIRERRERRERQEGKRRAEDVFSRGAIRLEIPALRAYVISGEGRKADIGLTPIEFKILYHLARNESKVVSREQLLATVWGEGTHVFDRATDKHVSSLRQKLGPCASYIETVARVGYQFTPQGGV